jgi:hypothetical protein
MNINLPKRPTGAGEDAQFFQWVYDTLTSLMRMQEVGGQKVSRTTRGFFTVGGTAATAPAQGLQWQDEFNINSSYQIGDLVQVTINLATNDPDYVAGTNYTGIWICVKTNPALPIAPGSNTKHCKRPMYPLPLDLTQIYWKLIAFGVRDVNVTDSVVGKKAYFCAADPRTSQ